MPPTTNQFQYKQVWADQYQKSNWTMPVYPVIADTQFSAGLQVGDTVHRRFRTNPIVAQPLGADGSYSPQKYTEGDEIFQINRQYEATVRIAKPQVLHTDLNATESYGTQLANAIWQNIEGYVLGVAQAGAGQVMDDGTFGGVAGNGLSVSIGNIAQLPIFAMERYVGANVVYQKNMKFGKLPYEDYGGMMSWLIPPQVWTVIETYMIARSTPMGDDAVANGFSGVFGKFNVFVVNTLPFTSQLAIGANPTDGDTMTIKGVTFRFKNALAANGDIKIGGSAAATVTNIAAALNAPAVTTANYQAFQSTDTTTANGFVIEKTKVLNGLTATDNVTSVGIKIVGAGKVSVSSAFTSGTNVFTPALQIVHSIFMIAKNVSLAIRKEPDIYENFVANSIAKDYVMWTVYDAKVFRDQARAIIDLLVRCDTLTEYSNIHA